jgi:hypothetical protein
MPAHLIICPYNHDRPYAEYDEERNCTCVSPSVRRRHGNARHALPVARLPSASALCLSMGTQNLAM